MNKSFRTSVFFALALSLPGLILAGDRVVFSNISLITMEDSQVRESQVVVTENGQITDIAAADEFDPLSGDLIIDGKGGFLIPGLIDTHIHIDHPQDLKMMALYGVTSAINMRGLPWHLKLRNEIRGGPVFAPDFITGGDYLDGDPPDMLSMASVAGADAARSAVRAMHAAGYDFIKVYSELSRDQYLAVCEESRKLGISVIGHIVDAATLEDLLECPHRNISHGEQLFKVLESREDLVEIQLLINALYEQGITLTPNRKLYNEMGRQPAELNQLLARPESALIHPATFQPWRPGINRYARRDEAWAGRVQKVYDDLGPIVNIARRVSPYMLVAGTDSPVAGSYPGVSLIDEIESLAEAGLDGFEALATATRNAGKLIKELQPDYPEVGVIHPGARADLVLVHNNPLENSDTLREPVGVMSRGHWHDQDMLRSYRSELKTENEKTAPQVKALESAVFGRDLEKATGMFKEFRDQSPDAVLFAQYPFFFYGFSLLYGENGLTDDPEQARKAVLLYDMYQQTYPEVHSAHHVYGLALEASGDVPGAISAQRRALEIWPQFPPAKKALDRLMADEVLGSEQSARIN